MEHVVFYQSAQGVPAFRRLPSLDDAVNFVEHLRNVEGVSDFSVHALASVPLSLRPYYHVEVAQTGTPQQPVPPPAAPAEPVGAHAAPAPVTVPAPMPVQAAPPAPAAFPAAPFADAPRVLEPVADPFVKDSPAEPESPDAAAPDAPPADAAEARDEGAPEPVTTDPTVEEVIPVPTGRRSMGFFARN